MSALPTKIADPVARMPRQMLSILNPFCCCLANAPCIILPKPLNMTLIEIENKSNGIEDTVVGEANAIPAKISANNPSPIFVKLSFFVPLDDSLEWEGFADKRISIQPVSTLSTPIVNNTIERIVIIKEICSVGKPSMIAKTDKVRDMIPLPICKERNHVGSLLLLLVFCNYAGDKRFLYLIRHYFSHLISHLGHLL
jgi:hypothetical protein